MEERIIEDEGRTIKVKRNALGGIEDATDAAVPADGTDGGAEGAEAAEGAAEAAAENAEDDVEIAVDFPEEEYDEDMVGLTPSQLKKLQEERERARKEAERERDKLVSRGQKALSDRDFSLAEELFSQALTYDEESEAALKGVWESRTQDFQDDSPFYIAENAEKFAQMPEEVRAYILERVGDRLRSERESALEEMRPLKAAVEEAREARRGALGDNKRYYLVRTTIFLVASVLFLALVGIFSSFLLRTRGSWPVVGMAVCGALALISLICLIVFLRGLVFALRLCADNERNEGTEDGRRLAVLEGELQCLSLILGDDEAPAFDDES